MTKTIAQRELRNENAKVIDAVRSGETFIITRQGEPVAELRPVRAGRKAFISRGEVAALAAELAAGPHLAATSAEAAKRQARLQEVEAKLEPLPFDGTAVRTYGLVVAAVVHEGRKPRSRFADLLIAATAHANGLDLYTRNDEDFAGLEDLVRVIAV